MPPRRCKARATASPSSSSTRAAPYEAFARRIQKFKDDLLALLRSPRAEGKTIHAYGASTKGNTILQFTGIDRSLVECAADRNPDKWGSETIGTHIPIVSEQESRAKEPDYYLVLPWHFLDEFVEREAAYLRGGGKLIVPLPELRVIEAPAAQSEPPPSRTARVEAALAPQLHARDTVGAA